MHYFLLQMYRNQVRCFLGMSVQRAGESQCEDFRGPVCKYLLQTNGFHVRGVDPSDLRMSMKNSPPVNQRTGRFSLSGCGGPVDNDSASCFVWNNTCHRSTGVVRAFWGASFVVKNEKDSLTDNHTGVTVTKDGTRAQSTWWVERTK